MDRLWIWLATIKYIGPVMQKKLLHHFHNDLQAIFQAQREELEEVPLLNKRMIDQILESRCFEKADKILKAVKQNRIELLTFNDKRYPEYANACAESPILLYMKGNLEEIDHAVGVVGARRCTDYGKKVAREIGEKLAERGVPLISGFAKGIDSYAQAACMNAGGRTVAFLGSGVEICYPAEQRKLYDQLIQMGSVFLSKYPPGTPAKPQQFIERNALISAWSKEVVIVEASEKSGALWTAEFARKQNKKVYAVPHSIYSKEGKGCNQLLASGVGPFLGIDSIIRNADPISEEAEKKEEHSPLLSIIDQGPSTITEIKNLLSSEISNIEEQLFSLELEGKIIIRGEQIVKI